MNSIQLEGFLRQRYGAVKRSRGRHGLELLVQCPICKKRNKLSINANTGMYQCWHGCISGHIDKLLGDVKAARFDQQEFRKPAPTAGPVDLPGELIRLVDLDQDHQAVQYLVGRGFNVKELDELYGLRYCREGKRYAGGLFNTSNTIVIPVYANGLLTAWQSRLLYNPDKIEDPEVMEALGWRQDEDGEWVRPPKYFTAPGWDKGKNFLNWDWARQGNLVVVVEGAFDAFAVGRCAMATFGKGVSEDQMRLLATYWDLAVLLLDPDARKDAERLYAGNPNCILMDLEGYKDAGEAPRDEIWRQIDRTVANHPVLARAGRTLDTYKFLV